MKVTVKLTQQVPSYAPLTQSEKKYNFEVSEKNKEIDIHNKSVKQKWQKLPKIKTKPRPIMELTPISLSYSLEFKDLIPTKDKDKDEKNLNKLLENIEGSILYQILQAYDNKVNFKQSLNGFNFGKNFEVSIQVGDKFSTLTSNETVKITDKSLPLFVYHIRQVLRSCFDSTQGKTANVQKAIELRAKTTNAKIEYVNNITRLQQANTIIVLEKPKKETKK